MKTGKGGRNKSRRGPEDPEGELGMRRDHETEEVEKFDYRRFDIRSSRDWYSVGEDTRSQIA